MSEPRGGVEPESGESTLGIKFFAVSAIVTGTVVLIALVAQFFVDGLASLIVTMAVLTALELVCLAGMIVARRAYLRRLRMGDVIVRKPWSGGGAP